jgi:lysophospholipase L1-like esterase
MRHKIVLLLGLTALAMTLVSAPAAVADPVNEYVALGDSYSSGLGAPVYDSATNTWKYEGTCKRSPLGYPQQWSKLHPAYVFKDHTCSGATIKKVTDEQLGDLSTRTKLVTLTVGGNDDGFGSTATDCLFGSDAVCKASTERGIAFARTTLTPQLTDLYREISRRAPNAFVLVFGYPHLVASTGSCGAVDLSANKRKYINANVDAVAEVTLAAAEAARKSVPDGKVTFAEMRGFFNNHEACSPTPWINGVDFAHASEMFHPNATGYQRNYLGLLNLFLS